HDPLDTADFQSSILNPRFAIEYLRRASECIILSVRAAAARQAQYHFTERGKKAMSTSTIEHILRQIDQLPRDEQLRLADLLAERRARQALETAKPPRDKRVPAQPWPEAQAAMKWLREHSHEYRGQWVALAGDRLIAHGTERAVVRAAHEAVGL